MLVAWSSVADSNKIAVEMRSSWEVQSSTVGRPDSEPGTLYSATYAIISAIKRISCSASLYRESTQWTEVINDYIAEQQPFRKELVT